MRIILIPVAGLESTIAARPCREQRRESREVSRESKEWERVRVERDQARRRVGGTAARSEVAREAFIIPLLYGEDVDWLKSVLAAGRATMEAKGETYDIFEPEVIGAAEASPLRAG